MWFRVACSWHQIADAAAPHNFPAGGTNLNSKDQANSVTDRESISEPVEWLAARDRDKHNPQHGNDPLPERRASRLLAAFILTGLIFVAFPGTLLGVWNLIAIARQHGAYVSTAWIQAHGQAQLFGWVGTFILGISLYVLPKSLNRSIQNFRLGWIAWALWTIGIAWRWFIGVGSPHWRIGIVGSATLQLAAFSLTQYLLWFERGDRDSKTGRAAGKKPFPRDLVSWLGFAGFTAFGIALLLGFAISVHLALYSAEPVFPTTANRMFLVIALWGFAIPVAWGYSSRFVTVFLGLRPPLQSEARWITAGVSGIVICALLQQFLLADILAGVATIGAVWVLQVFHASVRPPKRIGVYKHYPAFVRLAYGWLLVGAFLGIWADLSPKLTGLGGASRHALTVGFLALLIFSVGPLILPAFLASRELRSPMMMGLSLWLLAIGCFLRVASESIAYSSTASLAWEVLPVSAVLELAAVCVFVFNLGWTMFQAVPAWFEPSIVNSKTTVYFCVASFPKTRHVLVDSGLTTLGKIRDIPRSLTLEDAAKADNADLNKVLAELRAFFARRQPRRRAMN
jgi:hypothetical protein